MTCLALDVVGVAIVGAVGLAVMSPKEWHDVFLDLIRKRYGVGPGGTATEEEEDPDS